MTDSIKTHIEEPVIIKDMKKHLGNPENMKDLYDTLTALPKEEFYDLHPEELNETYRMYCSFRNKRDKDRDEEISCKLGELLRLKGNIEKIFGKLLYAINNFSPENFYYSEANEEALYEVFKEQTKTIFSNLIKQLDLYKKQITPEQLDQLDRDVIHRLYLVSKIEGSSLANTFNFLVENHLFTGKDNLDIALNKLIHINGNDIDTVLLNESYPTDNREARPSLLFTRYGFGKIQIKEIYPLIEHIVHQNNEKIQHLLRPFIPLYHWLHSVLEESNTAKISESKAITKEITDIKSLSKDIDIAKINELAEQNRHLRTLKNCDPKLLEEKLEILKSIFDLSNSEQKMIEK